LPPQLPWPQAEKTVEALSKFLELPIVDEEIADETFNAYTEVLGSLLQIDPTVDCLVRLMKCLDGYATNAKDLPRQRGVLATLYLLRKFVELRTSNTSPVCSLFAINHHGNMCYRKQSHLIYWHHGWVLWCHAAQTPLLVFANLHWMQWKHCCVCHYVLCVNISCNWPTEINALLNPATTEYAELLQRIAGLKYALAS